jgi:hypothetical protein
VGADRTRPLSTYIWERAPGRRDVGQASCGSRGGSRRRTSGCRARALTWGVPPKGHLILEPPHAFASSRASPSRRGGSGRALRSPSDHRAVEPESRFCIDIHGVGHEQITLGHEPITTGLSEASSQICRSGDSTFDERRSRAVNSRPPGVQVAQVSERKDLSIMHYDPQRGDPLGLMLLVLTVGLLVVAIAQLGFDIWG